MQSENPVTSDTELAIDINVAKETNSKDEKYV